MSEEAEDTLLPNSKETPSFPTVSLAWSLMAFRAELARV